MLFRTSNSCLVPPNQTIIKAFDLRLCAYPLYQQTILNKATDCYCAGEYVGHKNSKYMVECGLNKQDDHVVSGSEDGFIYIWDLIEANIKEKLQVKRSKVIHSLALHPQKDLMLAACEDKIYVYADELYELPE